MDPTASTILKVLPHMGNLRRATFIDMDDLELLGEASDSLANSKCSLEEIDLEIYLPEGVVFEMRLKGLPIWTKFDLSILRRLAIRIRTRALLLALGGTTYINDMLSNARALTHLNIDISTRVIAFIDILDCTLPNLEDLIISNTTGLLPVKPAPHNPSKTIDFFKRHPKLIRLSLPSHIHFSGFPPFITSESTPRLESFSYEELIHSHRVQLNKILSPTSARGLRHLTINEIDASLAYSDMDIYKDFTSLESCYIAETPVSSIMKDHKDTHRILKSLVGHVPNLQKIHLPSHRGFLQQEVQLETCSLLQYFTNLTHISGIWVNDLSPDGPEWQKLLQKLHPLCSLRYIIPAPHPAGLEKVVFRVFRDGQGQLMIKAVSESIPDCDATNWGGFYW